MLNLPFLKQTLQTFCFLIVSISTIPSSAVALEICNEETMDKGKKYIYDKSFSSRENAGDCYISGNERGLKPGHGVLRFANKEQMVCRINDEEYKRNYDDNWKESRNNTDNFNTACITANGEYLLRTGEFKEDANITSTLEYTGKDIPDRYKLTYSSIPGNLPWLPAKRSEIKLVKSANTARTVPIDWKLFTPYGAPQVKQVYLKGVEIDNLKTFPVIIDQNIATVTASSNDNFNTAGEMEIVVGNEYGESASIFIDVSFYTFKDDPSVLSLKMELSLARKLIADEMFLRAGDIASSSECLNHSTKKKDVNSKETPSCDIKEQYLLAEKALPSCGSPVRNKNDKVDCSALTEAQLATLKLIRADIAYRLILIENGVPFLGGYRSLKQTTPHQELIKLQALEQRMSDLIDKIRDAQWRTTDIEIKSAETEASRAYSIGQTKSQEITSSIAEVEAVNFDAEIARNRQHLESLASHISYLSKRGEEVEKQQDALSAQAGKLINQGLAAASGLPVNEVQTLASGDIEGALKLYVSEELKKTTSELTKKFADNNEMVSSINQAYKDFRKAEKEIRSTVDDVTKIPRELKHAREKLDSELQQANTLISGLRQDIGGTVLKGLAGSELKKIKEEIVTMVEELKPLGLRIEAAHKKIMKEGYPASMRKQFEDGLDEIVRTVKLSQQELNSIRNGLFDDLKVGLMDHEKRFVVSRLLQIVNSEAKDTKKGLIFLQGFYALYPELIDGGGGQFLDEILSEYKGKNRDRNTVYAIRKAIMNGVEEYSGAYGKGPDVFYSYGEKKLVFRIGLDERREDTYVKISIENLVERTLNNFDELKTKLPSDQQIQAFLDVTKNELADRHLLLIKSSMKGPENFARQMQQSIKDSNNSQNLEKAWDELNKRKNSIFNDSEVMEAPIEAVASLLVMASYENEVSQNVPLPIKNNTTNFPSEITNDNGLSPEANMALSAALNYAFPGAGVALQLGQTFASIDANNDLLADIEKETVRALAEYNQTQQAIKRATLDSAIAQKEQERALALAEAAEAQLRQFDVVMQISLNEKMELRALLAMYRPYLFYLSEMMRERFNAFDRSLAMWAHGKPSQGFFAQQITEDPRNVRFALDSEIHLFDWLNREREATKTDPFYLFNHWQQIITLAETYCADYGCKPGDSKLGKIAATVPVRLIADLGGTSIKRDFSDWKSNEDHKHNFIFPINLNGMENLIPPDFLNVRLIDINIVPITKSGEYLRGNMVNVKHTGSARIATLDKSTGKITIIEENLLPSKIMPPSNQYPFNLTTLAERFQSQTDLNSLLALRGFEGYGALGSYEFAVLHSPWIENVEDFEIQLAYVYQESTDITSEQDYINLLNNPCVLNESRDKAAINSKRQNVFNGLSEVITCKPKMQVTFSPFSIDATTGTYKCESNNTIKVDIENINNMPIIRSILEDKDREGLLRCASFNEVFQPSSRKVYDLSELATKRPKCTLSELINISVNDNANKSKCYGEML